MHAFRLAGLDAWGRYYGDAVFDPFSGASLVDQSVSGSPDPFVNDHQEIHDLSLPIPGGLETIDIAEGRIDRVAATADLRLGHGFGAFATFAYTDSENRDPATGGFGEPLPYIPETSARFGLTWVHPSNVKLTLAESCVGARAGDVTGTQLDGYWSTDVFLTWEPLDKRFSLELAAYNLFDQQFEVATSVPGWGRTFAGLFKVRF